MEKQTLVVSRVRWIFGLAVVLLLSALMLGIVDATRAQSSIQNVEPGDVKVNDDGICTLREAIIAANAEKKGGKPGDCEGDVVGADVIELDPGVYTLTRTDNGNEDSSQTGDLDITSTITIRAKEGSSGIVVIEGGAGFTDRVFHVLPGGNLTLQRVTVRGGNVKDIGGGIYNQGGTLAVTNSTIFNNTAAVSGGALYNAGSSTLNYVTIKDNNAPAADGLRNNSGTLQLDNSYIAGDSCSGSGTITGVKAKNLAPAGSELECNADLIENDDIVLGVKNDAIGKPAAFTPPTGSEAIDAATCPATPKFTDQVGLGRPQYAGCDIGAIELEDVNDPPVAVDDKEQDENGEYSGIDVLEDTSLDINVVANDYDPDIYRNSVLSSVIVVDGPSHGTAEPNLAKPGYITYTPDPHYVGTDSFTYNVCDDGLLCSTIPATVSIDVTPDQYIEVTNYCDVDATGQAESGSLRAAILQANSGTLHESGIDRIVFDPYESINGDRCVSVDNIIFLSSALPTLTQPVSIDGLAKDGSPGNFVTVPPATPYITLYGNDGPYSGITIGGDAVDNAGATTLASTVNNLLIAHFGEHGVVIEGNGAPGEGSTVSNNTIFANGGSGVLVGEPTNLADGNSILYNTIDNNCGSGVLIYGYEAIGDGTQPGDLLPTDFEGNLVQGNTLTNNGSCGLTFDYGTPDGVSVPVGQNNQIIDNYFNGNAGEPIDLAADGVSPNDGPSEDDVFDGDGGANTQQNFPFLDFALEGDETTPGGEGGLIIGKLFSTSGGSFTLQYYSSDTCEPQNLTLLAVTQNFIADAAPSDPVPNDGIMFTATQAKAVNPLIDGSFVIATATDQYGNTSEFGPCMEVDDDNSIFPRAWKAVPGTAKGQFSQPISHPGQVRWYYLEDVKPFSKITVKVTQPGSGVDVDVIGFKDLKEALAEQLGDKDLNELDAGNANNALDTAQFNASYINPPYINESEYLASYINASYINASYINEALFSADLYSASYINASYINDAFLNQAEYNASYINASYINASYINASYINASYINASYINGNAYSAAQMSSVISASANDGPEAEEMNIFTFNNPGDYYIRVQARNGAFDPIAEFNVTFEVDETLCGTIVEENVFAAANGGAAPSRLTGNAGNYEAIILVDWERMGLNDPANALDRDLLDASLAELIGDTNPANPNSINADIVDVGLDQEVAARNTQADDKWQCPYAKNLVADGIKEIIDSYRALNPTLEHIIILGNDDHIPFYRYPDQSGLGPEQQYVVPVNETTTSFASLASNTFLSQDAYGSTLGVGMKNNTLPTPGLGVGRLVETPQQIENMISEYLEEPLMVPDSALVTSYDFLVDGGEEVSADLATSVPVTELINNTWTATELENILNNPGGTERLFDIGYLSGHFSATAAQAADYETLYDTATLLQVPTDFYRGALIYSSGCHSGYNIVNDHAIPGYTPDNVSEPDWAAAMAQLGATFVGGTGYQYGDDEFVEYSERLYADFTRELLWGTNGGPIDIGTALVEAKKQYLLATPNMSGIHQKALLEATIFGMPMKSVNMPGDGPDKPTIEDSLPESSLAQVTDMPFPPFTDNPAVDTPGEVLSLHFLDLGLPEGGGDYVWTETEPPPRTLVVEPYTLVDGTGTVPVSHLIGPDGVLVDAGAPVLPLDKFEATVDPDGPGYEWVLRGVGFLGGTYTDVSGQVPLVAAAATESSAVHSAFMSFAHFPQELWSINRFDQLGNDGERTILNTTPAQHKTEPATGLQTSTRRQFDDLQLRLFYLPTNFLNGVDTGFNNPEVAAAPDIVSVLGEPIGTDKVDFTVEVVVDPSAGMQQVWVSYTTVDVPTENGEYKWIPFFLTQNQADPSQWTGTLDLADSGVAPQQVVFVVTAVNGVGVPTLSNNYGLYYTVGEAAETILTVDTYPTSGQIGDSIPFTAHLRLANGPTNFSEPQAVIVNIGADYRLGWTDANGDVTINLPLVNSQPGFEYVNGVPLWSGEPYEVTISFPGTAEFAASTASTPNPFTVYAGSTNVTLSPALAYVSSLQPDVPIDAFLKDGNVAGQGRALAELTVTFTVTNVDTGSSFQKAVITDQQGRARLGKVNLPVEATYEVTARFDGVATYTPSSTGGYSEILFNQPPDCSPVLIQTVQPSKPNLWPPNGDLIPVELVNATDLEDDANGLPLIYRLLQIYQDEQVIGNDFDATIIDGDPLKVGELRADRDGNLDGRVYHVSFEVKDSAGATCTDTVRMAVTHDQDNTDEALNLIDGGPLCNSLGPPDPTCVP